MGARIPVEITKPYHDYHLTDGDIRKIGWKIICLLGVDDAKKLVEFMKSELTDAK